MEILLTLFLAFLNVFLAISVTIHIVFRKRDSRAAIGWTGLVWLTPFIGTLLYVCFGVNRIQRKATALRVGQHWKHHQPHPLSVDEVAQRERFAMRHPQLLGLATLVRNISGRDVLPGNEVEPLPNGDTAFPRMLEAIRQATTSISLMSYIFDDDRVGNQFFEALVDASERGVQVRVLVDGVGVRYSRTNMAVRLTSAGVFAATFLPTRVPRLFRYANLRNHRKLLIVDGTTAFTGGTNIREGHWLELKPAVPVKCIHFHVCGPVVGQMQQVFALDWAFATDESLSGETWFPPIERAGEVWARGISDGPDEDFEQLTNTLIGALSMATDSARIVTPYFLPEGDLLRTLEITALRGVDVEIYLPSTNNIPFVQWASASLWAPLLERGCRVFLTPPPFDHSKLFVVDRTWSLIGSTNWDPRSLKLNFEYNVECYSEPFATRISAIIDEKAAIATEMTLDEIKAKKFLIRLRNNVARLLTPYL